MRGFGCKKQTIGISYGIVAKSLALSIFALMIASQIVSYGGPGTDLGTMFPALAFGGSAFVNHPSTTTQLNTIQNSTSPLQPGTVNYHNNWNNTLALSCSIPPTISQPLSSTQKNWSSSIQIPTQIFMFGSTGKSIQQNYTVYSNGTISVKDGFGNHFGFSLLGVQAPNGIVSSTFLSNSSYAVLNYLVSNSGVQVSNVSIVFATTYQFCKPSGLNVTITGNENWGILNSGTISFAFNTRPSYVLNNTAWFNNAFPAGQQNSSNSSLPTSPISLGFDWNDSVALNPVFSNATDSLSYTVGSNFTIDPTVIGTSTTNFATSNDYGDHVCQANGLYWLYYGNASSTPVYRTSTNGSTWSATKNFTSQISTNFEGPFSMYCSGTSVYYEGSIDSGSQAKFWWGDGTMQTNGTVTWTYQKSVTTGNKGVQDGSITVDTNGNLWVSEYESSPSNKIEVFESSNLATNSWTNKLSITSGLSGSPWATQIVPLTSGKMALLYGGAGSSQTAISIREWSGSSWSSAVSTSRTTLYMGRSAAAALGDTVELAVTGGVDVYYYSFTYGSSSWPSAVTIANSITSKTYASISSDANKELVISYLINSSVVQYVSSTNSGGSWSEPVTVLSTANTQQFLSASLTIQSNDFLIGWTSGSSSPYNIEFMAEPAVIPTAASDPLPWSQPGLSPYESYFSQLSESVSSGNGLLGVIQTDLSLPGRDGLSLNISRVYSTPYAFLSSANTPFEYDNYSLTNLGLGWSLNFPWLGSSYLHLTNGEVFAYNWTGSVFINHKTQNFALYANTNGTYTLFSASGMTYKFNAQKQLTTITSANGNNSIILAYGTHGISNITDDVGRVVTFSYNANGEVSTFSNGGRTWSYVYSTNGKLNNVTDPLSRLTQYHYWTGNPWLIQNVIYPSGGKSGYVYGNSPAGINVLTYYVTQQNEYTNSSSLSLTNSTSFSYHILNGQIQWVNTTTATGSGTEQNNLNYSFTGSTKQLVNIKNQTSQIIESQESLFNPSSFQQNETQLLSPSSNEISNTSTKFDNWGNIVYFQDSLGHIYYVSYSNTNTSNSFPGSSGFTNSFYTNSIASNIHDLVLGIADYQNGSGSAPQETYFQYNSAGELVQSKQLYKVGATNSWLYTSYTYDKYGNTLTGKDPLNRTSYYQYSSSYQSAYLTQSSILVGGTNISTTYVYNFTLGLVSSTKDPNGYNTSFAYDNIGRKTSIIYPLVGGVAAVETYSYNDTGNYYTTTDSNGNKIVYYSDGLGKVTKIAWYNGTSVYKTQNFTYSWLNKPITTKDPAGTTSYSYDSLARVYKITNPDTTTVTTSYDIPKSNYTTNDENGHPTEYINNLNGLLISTRVYNSSSKYYQTNNSYDQVGNTINMIDANGEKTTYQYDNLNRLTLEKFPDGTNQTFSYDNVGNMISIKTPNGTVISYGFDSLDRLTNVTFPNGNVIKYEYDKDGNQISVSFGSTSVLGSYDARDRLTNQTTVIGASKYSILFSYDKASNIVSMTYPDNSSLSFSYNGLEQLTKVGSFANLTYTLEGLMNTITYANGVKTTYSYNSVNEPTRILSVHGSTKLLDLNYSYDSYGNVKSIDQENYTYNWLNQLVSSNGPWGLINYTYDGTGNMLTLKQAGTTTSYSYGSFERLSSAGSASFTYDSNGNTLKIVNGSNTWKYTYDNLNGLTSISKNGVTVQNNTYDGAGHRVEQTLGGSTMVYLYRGPLVIYEKNLTSGVSTDFYQGDGMQLAQTLSGTSSYFVSDILSSTRLVLNSSGGIVFNSNYKPFGLSYSASGIAPTLYTGQIFDSSTGLYYYNARFYDPAIQRFLTEDPDPQTTGQNLYVYANDNPIINNDPSGKSIHNTQIKEIVNKLYLGLLGIWNLVVWVVEWGEYHQPNINSVIIGLLGLFGGPFGLTIAVIDVFLLTANLYVDTDGNVIMYFTEIWFPWPFALLQYLEIGFRTNQIFNVLGGTPIPVPKYPKLEYCAVWDSRTAGPPLLAPHYGAWPTQGFGFKPPGSPGSPL